MFGWLTAWPLSSWHILSLLLATIFEQDLGRWHPFLKQIACISNRQAMEEKQYVEIFCWCFPVVVFCWNMSTNFWNMLKYCVSFSQKVGFLLVLSEALSFRGVEISHFFPERTSNDWIPWWFWVWTKCFCLCRKQATAWANQPVLKKKEPIFYPNSFLEVRYVFGGSKWHLLSFGVWMKRRLVTNNTAAEESHGLSSCLNSRRCFGHLGWNPGWTTQRAGGGWNFPFLREAIWRWIRRYGFVQEFLLTLI